MVRENRIGHIAVYSLGPEVISCQFGVINLEQDVGIVDSGTVDLKVHD